MELKIGDIVGVVDEDCRHFGKQGQVVGFDLANKEAPIRVWFGRECDHIMHYSEREGFSDKHPLEPPNEAEQAKDMRTWNYAEKELEKTPEWRVETLGDRHFPHRYHSFCEPKEPFVADSRVCEIEGCRQAATRRIIYNFWGALNFADVCESCGKMYHLICTEYFPRKVK